jgi:dTMP kinase
VIEPALAAGRHVVCDRFSGSTVAYQAYGRGLDPGEVAGLSRWAAGGLEPDVVVLLRVEPLVAAARRAARSGPDDRIEQEDAEFFARIDAGFAAQAAADPRRWRVVEASGTVEDVARAVEGAVRAALPDLGPS